MIGVEFGKLSLDYGNKYFDNERAVLASYSFKLFNFDLDLFSGYYIDSADFAFVLDTSSENWNLSFSYVKSLISATLNINSWKISGNYSLLSANYDLSISIPLLEKYSVFGGYSHTSLIDKSHIGIALYEVDYSLGLKVKNEMSNIYFDIFGSVNF